MKKISVRSHGQDRISDLPRSVIDQILSFLPFRDAVKTSALSKNWKEKWHTIPHIIIDEKMFPGSYFRISKHNNLYNYENYFRSLEGLINYILAEHEGTIEKFSVFVQVEDPFNVKSWIYRLRQKGIQELFLLFLRGDYNELPSVLFSLHELRKLSIRRCVVKPPSTFRGFPSLVSLKLDKIHINNVAFEKIISNCPLLEQLTIRKLSCINCTNQSRYPHIDHFQINAPKLKYFCIDGEFLSMSLNIPFLEVLSINLFKNNSRYRYYKDDPSNLKFKFCGLPSTIKELYVRCAFQKYLDACDRIIEGATYSHLKTLQLDEFCFENEYQVRCLLSCLFRRSANLTTLDIAACGCKSKDISEPLTKFWEVLNNAPFMLNQLKKMRVRTFHGNDLEMKLIQYIMTNSRALKEMTVECIKNIPKLDEDEVNEVLQNLFKSSTTKLNFIGANGKSSSKTKKRKRIKTRTSSKGKIRTLMKYLEKIH